MTANDKQRTGTINAGRLARPESREKVAASILQFLAVLPEAHQKMFIWKHYCGWSEDQIAFRLQCGYATVESTLSEISRRLFAWAEAALIADSANSEKPGSQQE